MRKVVADVDDLISEDQITQWLLPLREAVPNFVITAYAVPNYLGPVHALRERYPWISFGIHGFQHTPCECLAWTQDMAEYFIGLALEMGYDPVFKAPNWSHDNETEIACHALGVAFHLHKEQVPQVKGLKAFTGQGVHTLHTHILRNPVTDFIGDHPGFRPEHLEGAQYLRVLEAL